MTGLLGPQSIPCRSRLRAVAPTETVKDSSHGCAAKNIKPRSRTCEEAVVRRSGLQTSRRTHSSTRSRHATVAKPLYQACKRTPNMDNSLVCGQASQPAPRHALAVEIPSWPAATCADSRLGRKPVWIAAKQNSRPWSSTAPQGPVRHWLRRVPRSAFNACRAVSVAAGFASSTRASLREKVDRRRRSSDIGAKRLDNPFAKGCNDSTCSIPTDTVLPENAFAFAMSNY